MNKRLKWLFFLGVILLASQISLISPTSPAEPDTAPQDQTPSNSQPLVKRVIDGDTVELENGDKVRYIGIDTPETLDPRKPVQCFGKNASAKKQRISGRKTGMVG